jgi:hypothetical protein
VTLIVVLGLVLLDVVDENKAELKQVEQRTAERIEELRQHITKSSSGNNALSGFVQVLQRASNELLMQ